MQIERLRLINFRQHEDTELILGAGLTGVIGPNGVGKTTLLEAIAWALYGAEAARGTRDTIRRRGGRGPGSRAGGTGFRAGASPLSRGPHPQRCGAVSGRRARTHRQQPAARCRTRSAGCWA